MSNILFPYRCSVLNKLKCQWIWASWRFPGRMVERQCDIIEWNHYGGTTSLDVEWGWFRVKGLAPFPQDKAVSIPNRVYVAA